MSPLRWLHRHELRELPFISVLVVVGAAIAFAAIEPQHWLRAVAVLSSGLVLAGALRLFLSDTQAGLLRNRSRVFDVTCYWLFAFLTGFFGVISPGR